MYVDESALAQAMDREDPDSTFCPHSLTAQLAEMDDGEMAVRVRLGGHWAMPDDAHTADVEVPAADLRIVDLFLTLDASALAADELNQLTSQGYQAQIDQGLEEI